MLRATRRGVEIPPTCVESTKKAKRDLVVSPVSLDSGFPKRFKVYVETPECIIVPQFWAGENLVGVVDARAPAATMACEFVGGLRPDLQQPQAARAALESMKLTGGAVLSLPTGYGKTVTAIYIACALGAKTVVVVGKEFLADQWEARIRAHAPTAKITRVQGRTCDASGDFVIAMLQTLAKRMHSVRAPPVFEDAALTIVDEAHHVGAEKLTMGLVGLSTPYTLGLSATPTRKDGLTRVMHWHLGPTAFVVQRTGQSNVTVRVVGYSHPRYFEPPPMNRRGDVCFASLMTMLTRLGERTEVVVNEAKKLADSGRRVLVLSHRREHAGEVADVLRSRGVDAATYLGGDKVAPECVVTCATFALVSEGYDDARLSALVLATPASDVVQACGRIMRGGGGSDPVIVDVADAFCVCHAQLAKRKRYYRSAGFTVESLGTRVAADGASDDEACMFA